MAGKIAIDFGTSNTRVAVWDEVAKVGRPLFIKGISQTNLLQVDGKEQQSYCIPTLIHYNSTSVSIGSQLVADNNENSPTTFKRIKHYINRRLELPRTVGARRISYSEAGSDFLNRLFDHISATVDFRNEEVIFTAPVDAYEHYQDWLAGVCEKAGITRWRLLDEPSAAALGYGVNIQANDVYLVFDFGGGTLDVAVVRIDGSAEGGKRCEVLGKSGASLGGTMIDDWLFLDALAQNKLKIEDVLQSSASLMLGAEKAKINLSVHDYASLSDTDPDTGRVIVASWSRSNFEDLLEANGFYTMIQKALDRAVDDAREKGFSRENIKAVLLTGGSSLIPSVKKTLTRIFGKDKVHYHRPLDAVVMGAAAFSEGDYIGRIYHDYALRHYNSKKQDYEYEILVKAGTVYPSAEPVHKLTIEAAFDQQKTFSLEIYEINRKHIGNEDEKIEIVFGSAGEARTVQKQDAKIISCFWMNEKTPTFIKAEPPATLGDKRFPTQFGIDGIKRLCVTVFDNENRKYIHTNQPVIRLT